MTNLGRFVADKQFSKPLTREEKALRIAMYEGWRLYLKADIRCDETMFIKNNNLNSTTQNMVLYSSFNGLMPIVEKVNKELNNTINISIDSAGVTVSLEVDGSNDLTFFIFPETPLIDALQDAILYYYENKEQL